MEPNEPHPPSHVSDPSGEQNRAPAAPASPGSAPARDPSDKATQLGLGLPEGVRRGNLRRPPNLAVIALTLLAYLLVLVAFGSWFHHRLMSDIESRIESARSNDARIEPAHVVAQPAPNAPAPAPA